MYFTSFGVYTAPYFSQHSHPAILISLTCPGNVYPVVEDAQNLISLKGKALMHGYQSHYVLTNYKGEIWEGKTLYYDEIIFDQESQILPIYLLELESTGEFLKKAMKKLGAIQERPIVRWH
eukprot:TRINITY_DN11215_c0_g1_i2.p2 TRINITY_DN11215_c0_g1~~TRINITY_DN11215_c0_g1_i2.p2  ORF type:complete len:121 (+),score=18.98 TRINITY_DN11215_c0_g1_i2:610-972(+)